MGDTRPPRRGYALEGVSGGGRASPFRGPSAGRRIDDGPVHRVRDLTEDRLQDPRSLQGLRPSRPNGPQPPALPPRQTAPAGARKADRRAETGLPAVGRAQDPGDIARPMRTPAVPG